MPNYKKVAQIITVWDSKGDIQAARQLLIQNADYLKKHAADLGSVQLDAACNLNTFQSKNLDDVRWARSRKAMRLEQYVTETQQSYGALPESTPAQVQESQAPQK